MNTTLLTEIAQFVAALAALIIIHELGHFVVARLLKVDVEEFGLGFPPRLATLFFAGGTRFSLNWIPLGGFVRPKGENDPSVPGGLAAANPWVRLGVYVAGPMANLLVGAILYTIIISRIGMPILDQVQIQDVVPNSPAGQAGLLPGDFIVKVNDIQIDSTQALQQAIQNNLETPTIIAYSREGQTAEVTLVPRSQPPAGQGAIGILMGNPYRSVSVFAAFPSGVAAVFQNGKELLALSF